MSWRYSELYVEQARLTIKRTNALFQSGAFLYQAEITQSFLCKAKREMFYTNSYAGVAQQVREILSLSPKRKQHGIMEKIKYLEELERKGLIEPPIPQTAYKYPVDILPNGRTRDFKTR